MVLVVISVQPAITAHWAVFKALTVQWARSAPEWDWRAALSVRHVPRAATVVRLDWRGPQGYAGQVGTQTWS